MSTLREAESPLAARTAPSDHRSGPPAALARLKALVLLGGSVRPTQLSAAIGRSVLDLPIAAGRRLLQHWQSHAGDLARSLGQERLSVRVMIDADAPMPDLPVADDSAAMSVERDPFDYRGTGGLLRDLTAGYADDDLVLVATAAQVLLEPLASLAVELARDDADVALVSHNTGVPSGLMLIRCSSLAMIAPVGFVDMKDQALPAIAQRHRVSVVRKDEPCGMPLRTLADYVAALRAYHEHLAGELHASPYEEDWHPAFALVEEGANVHPSARVHDSVVLRGGHVEADAVLVHSVVCPGGVVRRRRMVVAGLVTGGA
jgi:hypothetical protein